MWSQFRTLRRVRSHRSSERRPYHSPQTNSAHGLLGLCPRFLSTKDAASRQKNTSGKHPIGGWASYHLWVAEMRREGVRHAESQADGKLTRSVWHTINHFGLG